MSCITKVFKNFLFYWSCGIFIMVNAVSNYSHVHITTLARMYTYSKHFTYKNTNHLPVPKRSAANSWTFCCNDCWNLEVLERLFVHSPKFTNFTLHIPLPFTCFYFTFVNKPYRIFFFSLMMLWIFWYPFHSSLRPHLNFCQFLKCYWRTNFND